MTLEHLSPAKHSPTWQSFHQTPDEVLRDPDLTIEEKRELLASWGSDRFAVPSQPWLREIPGVQIRLKVADILHALRTLDKGDPPPCGGMAARPINYQKMKVAPDCSGAARDRELDVLQNLIAAQQRNLDRYCRLLATQLTDLERQYIHKRIAETSRELDELLQRLDRTRGAAPKSRLGL